MKNKGFWIFYLVWALFCMTMFVLAINDYIGEFNKSIEEFWPITVGSLRYRCFLELSVYLLIPLLIFYVYKAVNYEQTPKNNDSV